MEVIILLTTIGIAMPCTNENTPDAFTPSASKILFQCSLHPSAKAIQIQPVPRCRFQYEIVHLLEGIWCGNVYRLDEGIGQ